MTEIIRPQGPTKAAVLVIHSWWGLTPAFRDFAASLAEAGFLVALADLFDGKTARTEAEARALRRRPRRLPMYRSLGRDIAALRSDPDVGDAGIGVVGFSMGGHWAVWLSQRAEYGVGATVLYYAARGGRFDDCKAPILAHFAENDPWVRPTARSGMEAAIGRAGCSYRAFDYPGTTHWFAESDRVVEYDRAAATLAMRRTIGHLEDCLCR